VPVEYPCSWLLHSFGATYPPRGSEPAEAKFIIRGVTVLLDKFYVVLPALSEANVDRVKHIVDAEPDQRVYQNLKDDLVASHVMSDKNRQAGQHEASQRQEAFRSPGRNGS
jgi:hypothetical protein